MLTLKKKATLTVVFTVIVILAASLFHMGLPKGSLLAVYASEMISAASDEQETPEIQESMLSEAIETTGAIYIEKLDQYQDEIIEETYKQTNAYLIQNIASGTPLDEESAKWVVTYSKQFNIEPSLILAVISKESNFNRTSVGSSQDRGYMQIIPGTEKLLANKFGEQIGHTYNPSLIFEPEYNIGLGTAYLAFLRECHGEDTNRMLSEYNRGTVNLQRYYEKNGTYATEYSKSILQKEAEYQQFNY